MTDAEYESEMQRGGFSLEFESLDEVEEWLENRGRAITCERIRVGDWIIQVAPHADECRAQLAHRSYKGNIAQDSDD